MWLRSNRPAALRTAACSARSELYRTGICQPAKSVKAAPAATWMSCSGLSLSFGGASVMGEFSLRAGCEWNSPSVIGT